MSLTLIGRSKTCEDIPIATNEFIKKIQVTYDSSGINFFKATTSLEVNIQRGQPKSFDKEYIAEFQQYQPLAGFVGYELEAITALGFYRYMCDAPPKPVEPVEKPECSE